MASFNPYFKWLAIPADEQPPNHYRLLGLPAFIDDTDVIDGAAEQRTIYLRTFQTGPNAELAERLLNEISAARVCLLDENSKARYDQQLRAAVEPVPEKDPLAFTAAELASVASGPATRKGSRSRRKKRFWKEPWAIPAAAGGIVVLLLLTMMLFGSGEAPQDPANQSTNITPGNPQKPHPIASNETLPATSPSPTVNKQPEWIHESLLAYFHLNESDLTNLVSGRKSTWRDGDRAKGRWVQSFKRIPLHQTCPDRWGNQTGAAVGVFFVDDGDPKLYTLDSFTISIWFKWFNNHPTDEYRVLISKCPKTFNYDCNYMLMVKNDAGEGGSLGGKVSGGKGKEVPLDSGEVKVTDGKWHQATLTCDKEESVVKLFVDGKKVDQKRLIDGVTTVNCHASVGYWRGYNYSYGVFNGALDDLRIYKTTLTESQVNDLHAYESQRPPAMLPQK